MSISPEQKLAWRYPLAKRMVEDGTASPQVRRAVELLLDGKVAREIGAEMGLSTSFAQELLADPTGEKADARRRKNHGRCKSCGAKTFNGGSVDVPAQCARCFRRERHEKAQARVIHAIQRWVGLYGKPPTAMDWDLSTARSKAVPERLAEIEERHRGHDWPYPENAQRLFGSWNAAIRAAGFEPVRPGQRRDPERWKRNLRGAV